MQQSRNTRAARAEAALSTGRAELSPGDAWRQATLGASRRRYRNRELARKNRERLDNCSGAKDD